MTESLLRVACVDCPPARMRELFELQLPAQLELAFAASDDEAAALEAARGAHVLVTRHRFVGASLLEAAGPGLRLVQVQGRRPDRVDLAEARRRQITVAVMPSGGAIAVAEQTFALMLALVRRTVPGHEGVRSGSYRRLGLTPSRTTEEKIAFNWLRFEAVSELRGKTLGLVGFGEIGQEVARRARAFEMSVSYCQRTQLATEHEAALGVTYAALDDLLRDVDFVSLHAPHTPATQGLLDQGRLALLKPTAYLINTARGGLVDEAALVRCLERRRIAGAGLDVFVEEPLPAEHALTRLDNVVLAPHLGGGAGGGHRRHVAELLENVARVARGEAPRHRIA